MILGQNYNEQFHEHTSPFTDIFVYKNKIILYVTETTHGRTFNIIVALYIRIQFQHISRIVLLDKMGQPVDLLYCTTRFKLVIPLQPIRNAI